MAISLEVPRPMSMSMRGRAPVWVAVVATLLGLAVGYMIKQQCAANVWADSFQYSHLCYNDLQPLYGVRGISHGLVPYRDVQLEYPVLTGLFMDLMGRLLHLLDEAGVMTAGDPDYFRLSSIFLAPFALIVTLVLRPFVTAKRLALWAIGTPTILYSFHNWDLIAVAFASIGLVALEQNRDGVAGGALAAGASAKLFPAFLLPGALLSRWAKGDRKGAFGMAGAFFLIYLIVNLPVALLARGAPRVLDRPDWPEIVGSVQLRETGTNGWLGVWLFHADRYPDFGTVWYWIAHHSQAMFPGHGDWWQPGQTGYLGFVSITSFILFAVAAMFFLGVGWARRNEPQGYPVVAVGLGILASFLLFSKVHSPQFALWLVPLLALLNVSWPRILFYLAADVAVFVSGFYWFTVFDVPDPGWKGVFEVAVLLRALALGLLAWSAVKAVRELPETRAATA
ncbi:MAG TPA: hypothetical protein VND22_03615 [Actinomycetota bacterium]|nr:hypothetical protein [Actinomycetota bacterium]